MLTGMTTGTMWQNASAVAVDTPIDGDLGYGGDVDFFRFQAVAGYGYRVAVNTVSLPPPANYRLSSWRKRYPG